MSAVEDGNREQIEDTEVETDHRHEAEQRAVGADAAVEVRAHDPRQQRVEGRHRHHQDHGRGGDPGPDPGDAHRVPEAGPQLRQRAFARRSDALARASTPEQRGGGDERDRVDGPHGRGAGRAVQAGGDGGAEHQAALPRDREHRVRG